MSAEPKEIATLTFAGFSHWIKGGIVIAVHDPERMTTKLVSLTFDEIRQIAMATPGEESEA